MGYKNLPSYGYDMAFEVLECNKKSFVLRYINVEKTKQKSNNNNNNKS
jgi:hypothetical protein